MCMSAKDLKSASESEQGAIQCACECGKSKLSVSAEPVLRFCCHCSICQEVYQSPFSDFLVFKAEDVHLPALNGIQFKRYKAPPAVNRGKCPSCRKPVVGMLKLIPGMPLAMLPSAVYPDQQGLPEIKAHIFYNQRVAEVDDDSPKISGYVRSEWQVFKHVLSTLR